MEVDLKQQLVATMDLVLVGWSGRVGDAYADGM